jgi:hypothetical protein
MICANFGAWLIAALVSAVAEKSKLETIPA